MTVIAWDGKTLAADKRLDDVGRGWTSTKIVRTPSGALIGTSGPSGLGRWRRHWWIDGANPKDWPKGDGRLLVVLLGGVLNLFDDDVGYPIEIVDKHFAMGCGRDYALAAMYLGKTAAEAVAVASALDGYCGIGIDTLELQHGS